MNENYNEEKYIKDLIFQRLTNKEIPIDFPEELDGKDQNFVIPDGRRKDLRDVICFTIDGPDAKDLDDAISLSLTEKGYRLGVHIADVTAYVPYGSSVAAEAEKRGTTIYLPGGSVPMFPEYLSQDLCSLNADSDKRAISMFIDYDREGNILGYEVCRSFIRSRVRGVYSEVNSILDGTADDALLEKYAPVSDMIRNMHELATILRENRARSGADVSSKKESKYKFVNGLLEMTVTGGTEADMIVCEFMVAANVCMSYFFYDNNLPGIYRIQERTSFSARYSTKCRSHESLAVCAGYMRFTSPIRRAADYKIHAALTSFIEGMSAEEVAETYSEDFEKFCPKAMALEERAKGIEHGIIRECNLLYFARHTEETYEGVVLGKSSKTDEALITVKPFNIRILGSSMLTSFIGQSFKVKIAVDSQKRCLRVGHIARPEAA